MSEPMSDADIDKWLAKIPARLEDPDALPVDKALAAIDRLVEKQRQQRIDEAERARAKATEKT